jgi:uncharacterized protein (DUF58 family)
VIRTAAGPGPAARAAPQAGGRGAVPREVLRQVRLIELRTRGLVDTVFGGEYRSTFKGQGMEFAEVREYQHGDEVRAIEWNVTARMGHPYVKKHVEERELNVLLAVDLSGSGRFGTRGRLKIEVAAEIAAVLALAAVRNNDRIGLLLFTDRIEHVVPPRKGRRHVLRIIRDVLAYRAAGRGTDIAAALEYAGRLLRQRSIVFVLSDFQDPAGLAGPLPRALRLVGRRHDLVAITLADQAETELPDVGLLAVTDPETGQELVVDTGRAGVRTAFTAASRAESDALRRILLRNGVDAVDVRTDRPYAAPLLAFFRRRERRLRR